VAIHSGLRALAWCEPGTTGSPTGSRAELDAAIGRVAARLTDHSAEARSFGRHALA